MKLWNREYPIFCLLIHIEIDEISMVIFLPLYSEDSVFTYEDIAYFYRNISSHIFLTRRKPAILPIFI